MSELFDPEKVERFSDREASHMGWRERITVRASDYDRLLALYREAVGELRQERGLKALMANGIPESGDPEADRILAQLPIAEMVQRGWLPGIVSLEDVGALQTALCRFFKVETLADCLKPKFPHARICTIDP